MKKNLFWLPIRAWMWFWLQVWNLSEISGIGLGWFAPWVFAQMTGLDGKIKVKNSKHKGEPGNEN